MYNFWLYGAIAVFMILILTLFIKKI
jgi:hypothetical protein